MNRKILSLWVAVLLFLSPMVFHGGENFSAERDGLKSTVVVCSFNIRYGTAPDGLNSWKHRKESVVATIKTINPDVLGVQEAMTQQLTYLDGELPAYRRFGIGRDERGEGEYTAIYYKPEQMTLLDSGTFWLSETPEQLSTGWDAAFPRISTWGQFKMTEGGKEFVLFNTHWDHKGKESRKNSAKLLQRRSDAFQLPTILIGDFNCSPDSVPIQLLLNPIPDPSSDTAVTQEIKPYIDVATALGLEQTQKIGTFHRFRGKKPYPNRIDLILVNQDILPVEYKTDTSTRIDNPRRYPSDHFPVWARLLF